MTDVRERLTAVVPDDAGAQERAWALAHAAYVRRAQLRRRRAAHRRRLVVVLAVAGALTLALAAMTSAGGFVADLVAGGGEAARPQPAPRHRPAPARVDLPGGGRLLVVGGGWARIVADGQRPRRLARASEATFSAFGRYVAVADGRGLSVLAVDGRLVWSRAETRAVHTIRWSPDGLRVAYRTGSLLRIVDGNGERAHTVARAAGRALAWRPGPEPVLAFLRPGRRAMTLFDVATGRELARVRAPKDLDTLTWSSDGRRLLAVGPSELRVFSPRGALLRRRAAPAGLRFVTAAFAPRGRRLVLVSRRYGVDRVAVDGRVLLRAVKVGRPVWSPDGRWLLVPGRNRWVLYGPGRGTTPRLVPTPLPRVPVAGLQIAGWRRAPAP